MNLQDLFMQLFNHPRTLEDLGITEERSKQIMSATDAWKESLQNPFALACVLSAQINAADLDHTRCNAALGTLVLCARSGAHSALSAQ